MKNKLLLIIFLLLIFPVYVLADTYNYNSSVKQGNNYINASKYIDRNKYLILNQIPKFVLDENGRLSQNNSFVKGGFLNKTEYCLSTGSSDCNSKTYLLIPSSYWTLTQSGSSRYYINSVNGLSTKSDTETSSIRVTEFVKPNISVSGSGTYFNPWIFDNFYIVSLKTSKKSLAYFGDESNKKTSEEKYASEECIKGSGLCANFDINVQKGYENNPIDGCKLNLVSNNRINNNIILKKYEISNIKNDINCVVIFHKKSFNVKYNCSPGTGSIPSQKVLYGNNLTITNQLCKRAGYVQSNWKDSLGETWISGSTVKFDYDHGDKGIVDDVFTLNSNWKICPANTYKSASSTINTCTPCQRGYRSNEGADKCEKQTFTITLNPNTGSGNAYNVSVRYSDSVTLTNKFTKEKYRFNGWNTKPDGSGVAWDSSAFNFNFIAGEKGINGNNTVTLYAQWKIAVQINYIGHVYNSGYDPCSVPAVRVEDKAANVNKTHWNNCGLVVSANRFTHPPANYSGFGLLTPWQDKWGVYANQIGIYYSLNAPTSEISKMTPLSVIEWHKNSGINIYIYKLSPVQSPSNYEPIGEVHTITTNINHGNWAQWSSGIMIIDNIKNERSTHWGCYATSPQITRGVNVTGFGVILTGGTLSYDAKCGLGNYKLYSRENNIYYSTKSTYNEADLKPLSSLTWAGNANKLYYIYRKK